MVISPVVVSISPTLMYFAGMFLASEGKAGFRVVIDGTEGSVIVNPKQPSMGWKTGQRILLECTVGHIPERSNKFGSYPARLGVEVQAMLDEQLVLSQGEVSSSATLPAAPAPATPPAAPAPATQPAAPAPASVNGGAAATVGGRAPTPAR